MQPDDPNALLAQLRHDYAFVFGTPEGRRVLEDLRAAYDGQSHVKGDPYETAFKEGQRSVYRRIATMMRPTEGEATSARTDSR